jgi:endonuclease/exonuclease/phosphatase family metal-dependent hydrolase
MMSRSRHFSVGRVVIFIILVAGFFIAQGSEKIPDGAAGGDSFSGPAPATRPSGNLLTVSSFNMNGGVGKDDNILNLDRTADDLRARPSDLIGLQEVHGAKFLSGKDQAQILGEKLSMPWLFAPVEKQWWHDSFGDGALTTLPITHWQRFPLANPGGDSNREILILTLQFQDKPLHVLITHLERRDEAERAVELKTVIDLFESFQEPVILLGDLNANTSDPQIQALRKLPGLADPVGAAADAKNFPTIDWIFARGLKGVDAGFTDNGASDHPVAWATFSAP